MSEGHQFFFPILLSPGVLKSKRKHYSVQPTCNKRFLFVFLAARRNAADRDQHYLRRPGTPFR